MSRLIRALALAGLSCFPLSAFAEDLTFAWGPNPSTPQVDVALAKGYFKDAGLNVKFVPFASGREGFEALVGGQIDIVSMAEFPAATGLLTQQKFAVVGDLSRYSGMRLISKDASLASAADLAGKRVGSTIGTNTDFYLSEVLKSAGAEVTVVNVAPADLVPALSRGDVDVIAPFPTFYAAAEKMLGDGYQELRASSYETHYVLAVSPTMLEGEKLKALEAFLGALAKADADVKADSQAALAATAVAMQGAVSLEALAVMWKDSEFELNLSSDLSDLLLREAEWILTKGLIRGEKPTIETVKSYLAGAPLAAVSPEAVTLE
jgi:NitT/TauT family transport system substrate-binding protein